jgi:hypothetical protein
VTAVSIVLAILLWAIGVVAGLLLLLLTAILLLPADFQTRLDARLREDEESEWGVSGHTRWAVKVRWGWWILRLKARGDGFNVEELMVRICGFRVQAGRKRRPKPAEPGKAAKARRKRRLSLSDVRSYAREGLRLVRRLVASLRLRLRGDLVFGFPDPSVTGLVMAVLAVGGTPGNLRLRPDWLDPGLNGWAEAEGRIYGYEVVAALWSAYWRSPAGDRLRQRMTGIFKRISGGRTA